jgi:hypothetical protein
MKEYSLKSFGVPISIGLVALIFTVFWYQEWKYLLPTPKPERLAKVSVGTKIVLPFTVKQPTVLHFYSPDCPCSEFNMTSVQFLAKKYSSDVQFHVLIQADSAELSERDLISEFKEKYDLNAVVSIDTAKRIAKACGIYATPQAVVLKSDGVVYYKGNYNISRYCTNKKTFFVNIALEDLLNHKEKTIFSPQTEEAYGCELPPDYFEKITRQ